jgi:lysylphosphatidylglycerol synthetase-like protein (DUF2156 family)
MKNSSESSRSCASQFMWAVFIVLGAVWVVAYAAHLGGGRITFLLLISAAVLFLRSASNRKGALRRKAEADPRSEAA